MDVSGALGFQQLELPFCPQQLQTQKPTFSVPRRRNHLIVAAAKTKRRPPIEGVSEELNLIADQSLDFAPARRRVRSAFVDLQQQLDHCLFKVGVWFVENDFPSYMLLSVTNDLIVSVARDWNDWSVVGSNWDQNRRGNNYCVCKWVKYGWLRICVQHYLLFLLLGLYFVVVRNKFKGAGNFL